MDIPLCVYPNFLYELLGSIFTGLLEFFLVFDYTNPTAYDIYVRFLDYYEIAMESR